MDKSTQELDSMAVYLTELNFILFWTLLFTKALTMPQRRNREVSRTLFNYFRHQMDHLDLIV